MCALTVEASREVAASSPSSQGVANITLKDLMAVLKEIVPRNVYLLIQEALAKSIDATNDGIAGHYDQEAMLEKVYNVGLDEWQADAALLPTAGKESDTPETTAANGKGTGAGIGCALAVPVLLALAYQLGSMAISLELAGIGADATGAGAPAGLVMGIAGVILLAVVAIVMCALAFSGNLPGTTDTIPGHSNYNQGQQQLAVSNVQAAQQKVTQLQNMMTKLMQQFINPANSTKETAANIASAVIQWIKAQLWTQQG